MEIEITCPLGSDCEKAVEGKIIRCAWFVEVKGISPTGEEIDRWGCAMAWTPILQVEVARTNRGQTAALESMRNETVARQDRALELIDVTNIRS